MANDARVAGRRRHVRLPELPGPDRNDLGRGPRRRLPDRGARDALHRRRQRSQRTAGGPLRPAHRSGAELSLPVRPGQQRSDHTGRRYPEPMSPPHQVFPGRIELAVEMGETPAGGLYLDTDACPSDVVSGFKVYALPTARGFLSVHRST